MGLILDNLTNQTKVSYQVYLVVMICQIPFYAGLIFLSTSWLVRPFLLGTPIEFTEVLSNRPFINYVNVYTEEYSSLRASESKALKPSNGQRPVITLLACLLLWRSSVSSSLSEWLGAWISFLLIVPGCLSRAGLLLSHLIALRLFYIEDPIRQMVSLFFRVQWDVVKKSLLNSKKIPWIWVFSLLTALFFFFLLKGVCFCFYNKPPGSLFAFEGSQTVTRNGSQARLFLDPICSRDSGSCHVYLTLPENSTHFAFLNGIYLS